MRSLHQAFLVAVFFLLSTVSAASHVGNGAIALPEARMTQPTFVKDAKSHRASVKLDTLEKATTSIRGGAAAQTTKALYGIAVMAMIEAGLKKFFAATNIKFPSQLGGCIFLFAVAVLAQAVSPGSGDAIQAFLDPGCALLNKWLPSFFVPGLAMLPLAPSIGSGMEVKYYV